MDNVQNEEIRFLIKALKEEIKPQRGTVEYALMLILKSNTMILDSIISIREDLAVLVKNSGNLDS